MDKQQTIKKASIWRYLNPKNLMSDIHRCGYDFSLSSYLKFLLLFYAGVGVFSYIYGLKLPFIIFVMVFCGLFFPSILLITYRNMYEQKKFVDATQYMEQLLFSFKKKSKIRNALIDTLALFPEGQLHDAIEKAINHIETSNTTGDIYEEAFAFIEEEYGCKKLYTVHDFLIKVEALGGEFERNLDILLADEQLWIDRIYELQNEKKKHKRNITICICFSFIIIALATLMLPPQFNITENIVSQVVTTLVIIMKFLIWFIGQKKLSGSWINVEKDTPFKELERHYDRVMYEDLKKEKKKWKIIGYCIAPFSIVAYFAFHYLPLSIGVLALAVVCGSNPTRIYKKSLKKVTKEVEKIFPEWLMEMALLLQVDNVHVSLAKTIPNAPLLLKEELENLLQGIDENPNAIEPYIQFFNKIDVPDVNTAMKMLYSMAEYGAEDIGKQIASLIKRNSAMMDRASRLYAEDYLAGVGFLALLPMLTSVFKLLVDLVLSMTSILSMTTTIF